MDPHHLLEKACTLLLADPQVHIAEFSHLAPRTEPGQREKWIDAAGKHQVQTGGCMVEQKLEGGVDRRLVDRMIVIQNEHHFLGS